MSLAEKLSKYCAEKKVATKGPLAVVLFVTRKAKVLGLPLDIAQLTAKSGTQVAGLNKRSVQTILAEYGIIRTLAEECGRTSRGSIKNMEDYVAFLNNLLTTGEVDLDIVEAYWVERVKLFFSSKPFNLRLDQGVSINAIVRDLLSQAEKRQRENPGTMYAGAMLQHLVGAKLQVLAGESTHLEHHGFSVADAPTGRSGDFFFGNTIIHVTMSPSESLMEKCVSNIHAGYRPFIVTVFNRSIAARQLAELQSIVQKIEIIDVEQFISTNIYEWSDFDSAKQKSTVENLLSIYNSLIDTYETDPSLKVNLS